MNNKKFLYDGWHKIEEIEVEMKGNTVKREKLHLKSAVSALVVDKCGKVALVKQFRPCTGEYLYEIPAGCLDKEDKTPKEIIIEELQEECEISYDDIDYISEPIYSYYMACGSSDATNSIYFIRLNCEGINKKVKDADVEEVVWINKDEYWKFKIENKLKDAKTLLALRHYLQLLV